jgi:hypothetical protein
MIVKPLLGPDPCKRRVFLPKRMDDLAFYLFGAFWLYITDHCNDAKVTTAMLPISARYLCRNTKHRADFSR